jgi:hypothetical protein
METASSLKVESSHFAQATISCSRCPRKLQASRQYSGDQVKTSIALDFTVRRMNQDVETEVVETDAKRGWSEVNGLVVCGRCKDPT